VVQHIKDPVHTPFFTTEDFARFKSNGNALSLLCAYWWPVQIVRVVDDKIVRINYLGYSEAYDKDVELSLLRPRQTPTRSSHPLFQTTSSWTGAHVGVRLHQSASKELGDSFAWISGIVSEVLAVNNRPLRAKVKLQVATAAQTQQLGFDPAQMFDTCWVDVTCLAVLQDKDAFAQKQWFS